MFPVNLSLDYTAFLFRENRSHGTDGRGATINSGPQGEPCSQPTICVTKSQISNDTMR